MYALLWSLLLAGDLVLAGPYERSSEEDPMITAESRQAKCGYESCHLTKPGALNVHLIAHTHDDVGWLKTVDQYYYGSKSMIQKAGVQYILDSVIDELMKDPARRFVYVETAFFWRWWQQQDDQRRHHVRRLVAEGRLEFAGGAWSMNDEATTHYHSVLDQLTWGLRKLNDTFGECGRPRIGWQIDPFGHSREFASMLAQSGYDALMLGRSDYQDRSRRMSTKEAEMIWRGNDDLGKRSDIFTGIMFNTYSPPPGFCFDILCADDPIIDDPRSPDNNVNTMVTRFLEYVNRQAASYNTDNIIITMGDDFNYQDAHMWFKNLDKLIKLVNNFLDYVKREQKAYKTDHITVTMGGDFTYMDSHVWYKNMDKLIKYVNARDPNVHLMYSTPGCYVKAVNDAGVTFPTKQDDFFPYASDGNSYWTGYFTSRPTLKYFERRGNNFLQVCKQLYAMTNLNEKDKVDLNMLREAMGVMQHHDAVTGTEKQHVANDYARLLEEGMRDCLITVDEALNKLMSEKATGQKKSRRRLLRKSQVPYMPMNMCEFNITQCDISENTKSFVMTIYNPLGHVINHYVRIPVTGDSFVVKDSSGTEMDTQLITVAESTKQQLLTRKSNATAELIFLAKLLPPLGYRSYYVTSTSAAQNPHNVDDIKKTSDYKEPVPDIDIYDFVSNFKEGEEKIDNKLLEDKMMADRRAPTIINSNLVPVLKLSGANSDQTGEFIKAYAEENLSIGNEFLKLMVNPTTGLVSNLNYTVDGVSIVMPLSQELLYYEGMIGNNEIAANRSSGAYIFRPTPNSAKKISSKPENSVFKGPLVEELHQKFSNWATQIVRIYKGDRHVEFEWLVGSIPIEDNIGKEVISRFTTEIKSNSTFYTDSNGRQMLKRIRNKRPTWDLELQEPVAGNYYPVTSMISIRDSDTPLQMYVLTDRAQGGSSLKDGSVELMVHRRLIHDDAFGVGEALNELEDGRGLVAKGTHYLIVGTSKQAFPIAAHSRHLALQKLLQPVDLITPANNMTFAEWTLAKNEFSGLETELSSNVHLLTLEPWKDRTILVRLENYWSGEDVLSLAPAVVRLDRLFSGIKLLSVRETTLSGNQFLKDSERLQWTSKSMVDNFNDAYQPNGRPMTGDQQKEYRDDYFPTGSGEMAKDSPIPKEAPNRQQRNNNRQKKERQSRDDVEYVEIILKPMEIRTFIIEAKFLD